MFCFVKTVLFIYNNEIREDFVEFLNPREEFISEECEEEHNRVADKALTGEAIGRIVLGIMEKHGFPTKYCVGVG